MLIVGLGSFVTKFAEEQPPLAAEEPDEEPDGRAAQEVFDQPELRREILRYVIPTPEQRAERERVRAERERERARRERRRQYEEMGLPPDQIEEQLFDELETESEEEFDGGFGGGGAQPSKSAPIAPTPPPRDELAAEDIEFVEAENELSLADMKREHEEMRRKEGRFLNSRSTNRKLRREIQRLGELIREKEHQILREERAPLTRFL